MSKKKNRVEKVSQETGVEAKDLERLPVEAIEKLDALVPDAVLDQEAPQSDAPVLPESESGSGSDTDSSEVPQIESPVLDKPKRFVGYHPSTLEKVYL